MSSLIIGIISGVIASIVIYIFVFMIRPNINISDKIAQSSDNGECIYRIKIVNNSLCALFNVDYHLHFCSSKSDGLVNIEEITPLKSKITYISGFKSKKRDENEKYAVRITFKIDESKYKLDDHSFLMFTLIATHGFTNTSKYIEKTYYIDDISKGHFETGKSMRILNI